MSKGPGWKYCTEDIGSVPRVLKGGTRKLHLCRYPRGREVCGGILRTLIIPAWHFGENNWPATESGLAEACAWAGIRCTNMMRRQLARWNEWADRCDAEAASVEDNAT